MSDKITTATCKTALVQAWPAIFGTELSEEASRWKRVSKKGKKGEPIERVFYHDTLPLQALVVEEKGCISRTVIRGFAPFDADEESESQAQAQMLERSTTNEAFEFFQNYPCYRPCDFAFSICSEEEAESEVWYELTPTANFGRILSPYDGQLDYFIARHLPEGDSEVTECTFASERSREETIAELLRRGFLDGDKFAPQVSHS